ncbi:MAG TPA: ATP-grasp domain-containing protein [Candidatus Eisenbacteria bacterium]|jgi:biotin carboxylase
MPRVLLLSSTTSYRAGAFLDAARAIGAEVVVGSDQPQVLAALHPAGNLTLDFSDPDRAAEAIVAFARGRPLDAVLATDDEGVVLAATAAAALGLATSPVAAVSAARHKVAARERLAMAGLPSPAFEVFPVEADPDEVARRASFPCVVKPVALAASRGVIRADDPEQLARAFRRVAALLALEGGSQRTSRKILVESYIPGDEVAVEGLVRGGDQRLLAVFDKPDPLEGPYFEETLYVTPSRHPAVVQAAVTAATQRMVEALGLLEGPVHAELRINPQGVWPLEIAPRSIGGLCSRALRFGDGVTLEELILRHALGLDVAGLKREACASGVMMIPIPGAGVLRAVTGQEEAERVPGIEEVRITIPIGQPVVPLPEGARYLGFLFARADQPETVEQALREAHRRLGFEIDQIQGGRA